MKGRYNVFDQGFFPFFLERKTGSSLLEGTDARVLHVQ